MHQLHAGTFLVGRDRELGELLQALDDAESGRGRLVLLGGEPGIGKSRLADELAGRARARGHLVLWGRGWEDAGAPPYWPWVQALRVYLRSTSVERIREQMGSGVKDVAQMLPELRDLFPDLPAPPDVVSESARFRLFDSAATLLRNVARARPLLVILDDLQAADTPSILFLRFLASQLGDMRVLLVGTYRDVELTPEHPLTPTLGEVGREPVTRLVQLRGLNAAAVMEYIGIATNLQPQDALVAAVWRATNGNPLFVGEAVRLLSAEGRLTDVADLSSFHVTIPPGVRAVIARRIGHLEAEAAQLLRLGAALGPEFSLDVLCKVGEYDSDLALDGIDAAVEAGLLLPVAGAPGRYRFSHDLVRETLHDAVSPGRRARLHERISSVLEEFYGPSIELHLAELAYHFGQAAQRGDVRAGGTERIAAKAVDYAKRAGDDAARSLAYEEAARLYSMAVAGLDLGLTPDDDMRAEVLLALGDVQTRAGDLDLARAAFLGAADIARRTGVADQLARAALGLGGRHHWARPGNETRLIPLLQDALVMLGGSDERLRARLLTRLACAWRSSPERREDSAALSGQAVEIARRLGDLEVLSYSLTGRFWATWWPENPDVREATAREALSVAEALGDGDRIADAHLLALMMLIEQGRLVEARTEIGTLTRVIHDLRQPVQLWLGPVHRAALALAMGDFEEAEDSIAREMESSLRETPGHDNVSAARLHRFLLRREQGRIAEEEAAARASVADFPWYPFHRAALACLLIDIGRVAEARAVFDDLARDHFRVIYRDNGWLLAMSFTAEACARLGDAPAAAILYQQLLPFTGRHAVGTPEGSVGAIDRYLGLLAATRGRVDEAVDHLTDAIVLNEAMGALPWMVHSQHDLAQVLRQRDGSGDRARAEQLDGAARAMAARLGMALAEEIGEPNGAALPEAKVGPVASGTFHREGEYWSIEFGAETVRVRDSKGMRHLARLLASPGQEVHALELARLESPGAGRPPARETDLAADALGDGGPVLDAEAKAAYRRRLAELRAELEEAEAWNDIERVARAQSEERALTHELAGAVGLGGRDRSAVSSAERARVSVTRAIRAALERIAEEQTAIGQHLQATIRTGTFCSYVPDPRAPINWRQ